jgi:hypothetical protein
VPVNDCITIHMTVTVTVRLFIHSKKDSLNKSIARMYYRNKIYIKYNLVRNGVVGGNHSVSQVVWPERPLIT